MPELTSATTSALVAVNTILLVIVGVFFTRLINALDTVTKRQQDIELKHVAIQAQITHITEKLVELVKVTGLPERVGLLEKSTRDNSKDIGFLRDRQHDLANKINGVYGMCQVEQLRGQKYQLKDWPER